MTAMPEPAVLDPYVVVSDAYASVRDECQCELDVVEGRMPDALDGVLFRNGPGSLQMGPDRYMHPFDGDGMLTRFEFSRGRVLYRNRFVATRERLEELRHGRMRHRAFGTNVPGGLAHNALRMRFKNAANTNVVWHGGRLLALWEGGLPHEIDPATLGTVGRFDFGGGLRPGRFDLLDRLLSPELPFAAHPRIDPRTGDLYDFGTLMGATNRLMIYRVDRCGVLRERRCIPLNTLPFVHDFVLTERHLVFFLPPVRFDIARAVLGLESPVEALRHAQGQPTRILLVPRDGGAPRTLETRGGFVFHFANGFEADGRIVIDGARMSAFEGGTIDVRDPVALRKSSIFHALPTRFELDLARGHVSERTLGEHLVELPTIDPRRATIRHRTFFSIARAAGDVSPLHQALARTHPDGEAPVLRSFAPDLPGEPIFVPRGPDAAEGDGFLLTLVFRARARRSELVCLDATTLETVAVAALPHAVPPGFHGCFVPRGE
jgi:all-trans-8'-apo-beta-carotenal 15,15'-oxygenase